MPKEISERPKVYLSKVHLKGFKSIEDVTIDFKRNFNVLIGKNGSGKSNLIELLFKAINFNRSRDKISFEFAKITLLSTDNHFFSFELERFLRKNNFINNDEIDDRIGVKERFLIDDTLLIDDLNKYSVRKKIEFNGKNIAYSHNKNILISKMGYQPIYSLIIKFNSPEKLDFINAPGSLKYDFDEIVGFLDYPESMNFFTPIILEVESYFEALEENDIDFNTIKVDDILDKFRVQGSILENLQLYSPVEDVRFSPNMNLYHNDNNLIVDNIRIEFKVNNIWMPWSQLSDGTKRLFYIIAETTYSNGLVLIEEPELGVHPHQFNLLMDFLKTQSETKQIIISTHSPKALDHLSKDELDSILIASYDLKKGTQIRHLTTTEIKKAKKYMKEVGFFSDYWMLSDLEE
ncbi:AAA family ATPase [Mucilaginibacter galii]|uniref:ATPase AAA-type core domain-containing protein n=1 Tax=Mucilaginibacter galii TaxID=2005073 RepID=A0A917J9K4_9SPHI|nr:ATP-binding protein [Mucilaginibacter galii]GGI51313.1 hypothetical protein GCM10011425_25250 [Mucilaginibacter galii]